jgi:hypothetical protein
MTVDVSEIRREKFAKDNQRTPSLAKIIKRHGTFPDMHEISNYLFNEAD